MSLNKVAVNCNEMSEHIPANSIVLTLDFTDNWLLSHYSNYLGIDKPMVLMENYEAATGYFPVNWNQNTMPNTLFGDLSWNDVPCIEWHSNTANNEQVIEYVFVLGELDSKVDSCNQIVKQNLSNYYMQTFRNESCTLYQRKRK